MEIDRFTAAERPERILVSKCTFTDPSRALSGIKIKNCTCNVLCRRSELALGGSPGAVKAGVCRRHQVDGAPALAHLHVVCPVSAAGRVCRLCAPCGVTERARCTVVAN